MLKLNQDTSVQPKIMYFDNDDDFYQFCVVPEIITSEYTKADGTIGYVADWDFSTQYKNAINNGIRFVIKDEDSQICKHGEITFRVNTKPIQNLDPYYPIPNKLLKGVTKLDTYINDEEH